MDDQSLALLKGKVASVADLDVLRTFNAAIPAALLELLGSLPVAGVVFRLAPDDDISGLGAEYRVMTAEEAVEEATKLYPGISAAPLGYVPIASCWEGSGDPYFVHCPTGRIFRIPHDAARIGRTPELDESLIEPVAESFARLLELSDVAR